MRLSKLFLPTLKENPTEAQIPSHRLMLRAGMIRQSSAGIYTWLPLGCTVLKKIETIVREEMNQTGAQEVLMPTIQPAEIWKESGRYNDYGKEMLRISDRHKRELLYGPTHEEVITDVFRNTIKSYKDLPYNLYQIHWKFRDEVRPRFGVMRGREFFMKDCYSFDIDKSSAKHSYNKMFMAYLRCYARLGLKPIPMQADTGAIGGDLSHEFIVLADTGESEVYCDVDWLKMDPLSLDINYENNLEQYVEEWTKLYAATDNKHSSTNCPLPDSRLHKGRGIEVGHIFYFGTKYSESMGAKVTNVNGLDIPVEMGSYGIGVSRLVGAIIEANHDDAGIIWPDSVTPYKIGIINIKYGDSKCDQMCEKIYKELKNKNIEVLYDDRPERAGVKFANMDLIGLPWQITVGPRNTKDGLVELCRRGNNEQKITLSIDSVLSRTY
ncbi:MAG: proline--tRNA ligase [Rhodospirillaceae bacterium]|mgnify:CR=1 FL=1|nr:proline--tRNA ligase [Rhodospirillaceae bacterium]|tara:strand:+ start:2986 stop:4299 length:1314 start_codon:yes stop_codon:yes gene_type:complete